MPGNFGTRDLGEYHVAALDGTIGIAMYPAIGITDNGWRERHERRGRNFANATLDVKISRSRFNAGSLGEWIRLQPHGSAVPKCVYKFIHSNANPIKSKASGAKKTETTMLRHLDDKPSGGNTIGHRSGDIREPCPVSFGEASITQPLRIHRGKNSGHRPRMCLCPIWLFGRQRATAGDSQLTGGRIEHDKDGLAYLLRLLGNGAGGKRWRIRATPEGNRSHKFRPRTLLQLLWSVAF